MWNPNKNLKLFLDISTYCNAACPQCHRTDVYGLGKTKDLPLVQWTIDQFITAFPADECKNVSYWDICGTWGDPLMNKDIIKIVNYIKENSKGLISITTNGSMRDEDFFWELGMNGKEQLQVCFAVDGINQQMHQHYRRKTELAKVLNHMQVIGKETQSKAISQTVLFKHNDNYKDQIKKLCFDFGSTSHSFVVSNRFGPAGWTGYHHKSEKNEKSYFVDENGNEQFFEPANLDKLKNKTLTLGKYSTIEEQKENIHCRWANGNKILINPDGQVAPCCYTGNSLYMKKHFFTKNKTQEVQEAIMIEYLNNQESYNIFKNKLSDILKTPWFKDRLKESFNNIASSICSSNCGKKSSVKYYRGTG